MVKHLDVFSGIGGFALAADTVWGKVEHTFIEIDPFCQNVLKKHWEGATIHGDIRQFITDTARAGLQGGSRQPRQLDGVWQNEKPYILTGGFPCQPFSHAGRRKGTDDNRYLWPEMFRVIQLTKPTWVIAENVGGLVSWNEGMVLEQVCADLEAEGYEVQPLIIPAVAVNAPHRRDRIWIIASHTEHDGQHGAEDAQGGSEGGDRNAARPDKVQQLEGANSLRNTTANSAPTGKRGSGLERQPLEKVAQLTLNNWELDWQEVAAATCDASVDDGLSNVMVRLPDGTEITGKKWRQQAIRAAGNAIVPQVATQIMRAIKDTG